MEGDGHRPPHHSAAPGEGPFATSLSAVHEEGGGADAVTQSNRGQLRRVPTALQNVRSSYSPLRHSPDRARGAIEPKRHYARGTGSRIPALDNVQEDGERVQKNFSTTLELEEKELLALRHALRETGGNFSEVFEESI